MTFQVTHASRALEPENHCPPKVGEADHSLPLRSNHGESLLGSGGFPRTALAWRVKATIPIEPDRPSPLGDQRQQMTPRPGTPAWRLPCQELDDLVFGLRAGKGRGPPCVLSVGTKSPGRGGVTPGGVTPSPARSHNRNPPLASRRKIAPSVGSGLGPKNPGHSASCLPPDTPAGSALRADLKKPGRADPRGVHRRAPAPAQVSCHRTHPPRTASAAHR